MPPVVASAACQAARQNGPAAPIPGRHALADEFGDPQDPQARSAAAAAGKRRKRRSHSHAVLCGKLAPKQRMPKLEMLTPKGEHFIPCSTRVMFDGRISLDGIATAKTL